MRRLHRSRHRSEHSITARPRSLRSWFSMPFFGVRPPPLRCSRCPHWTFIFIPLSPSCKAGSFKSRRACCALMVLDALLWRRAAAVVVLSPSTLDVYTVLAIVQGDRQVETRSLRSRCSMPFFGVGPRPSLCALAVHNGRLYRSRHRAGQSFKSRRARCAFMVLDALLWRRTAAVADLSPSRHRAGRLFKSRRARCALIVLDALLWRRAAAVVVLSPSTLDVYTALAIVQGDRSSRDAMFALTVLDALL